MESKYLDFIEDTIPNRKTPIVYVLNKSTTYLGVIYFYPSWRKFIFRPGADIIFDTNCLLDIVNKLNELQENWKEGLKKNG